MWAELCLLAAQRRAPQPKVSVVENRAVRFMKAVNEGRLRLGAAIMGVCNVTPDSFSDGGRYAARDLACARVDEMIREGADIIDIGGESTRPGAPSVPAREQLARVLDVVRYAAAKAVVSIDTTSPEVAAACLDAGASAVNDVSCLRDRDLARVASGSRAALVISHGRAPQETMKGFGGISEGAYASVVPDVLRELSDAARIACELGVRKEEIVCDPGLGFSKSSRHSMTLLRKMNEFVVGCEFPVLVGASRKSFLTLIDKDASPEERTGASIIAAVHSVGAGASVVRVHDVRATAQALRLGHVLSTHGHAFTGPKELPYNVAPLSTPSKRGA